MADSRGSLTLDPALRRALSTILPGREERALLRILLLDGEPAREAWADFRRSVPDLPALFRTDTGGRKRLAPLLLRALRRLEVEDDPELMTVLRTAWLRGAS